MENVPKFGRLPEWLVKQQRTKCLNAGPVRLKVFGETTKFKLPLVLAKQGQDQKSLRRTVDNGVFADGVVVQELACQATVVAARKIA
jgi:hypothetical protein